MTITHHKGLEHPRIRTRACVKESLSSTVLATVDLGSGRCGYCGGRDQPGWWGSYLRARAFLLREEVLQASSLTVWGRALRAVSLPSVGDWRLWKTSRWLVNRKWVMGSMYIVSLMAVMYAVEGSNGDNVGYM